MEKPSAAALPVNRFVSTFCGAFRAFHIYNQDNKALDEIMANLTKRFDDAAPSTLKLKITNRSFLLESEPVGNKELSVHLCAALNALGFKEIIFQPPLQARHFFQLLTILSRKEPDNAKIEKLEAHFGEAEERPITLVPITANVLSIRLSDELVTKRMAPLLVPKSQGGTGFLEEMAAATIASLPDLYTWICIRAQILPPALKTFLRSLTDATREGYFPWERFSRLVPLPERLKALLNAAVATPAVRKRKAGLLGQRFRPAAKGSSARVDRATLLSVFSSEEAVRHASIRAVTGQQSSNQNLDLAESLVSDSGPNFTLGLLFLVRTLAEKNPVPVQERAFKLGMAIWLKVSAGAPDPGAAALLSSLRQRLSSTENIGLALFPLRTPPMESEAFIRQSQELLSLGDALLPGLILSLDTEQDRGMRRKLCHLITRVAQERGVDFLIEYLSKSSPFLIRNIVLILGDVKNAASVKAIASLVGHPQKIVRIEALRSIVKIGGEEAASAARATLSRTADADEKKLALDFLVQRKEPGLVDTVIRLAKDPATPPEWRKVLYFTLGTLGGPQAKAFLESLLQRGSFLDRLSSADREETAFIKSALARIP